MVFGLLALIPFKTHQIYFLAPPLLVMFTELSNPKSPARKKQVYIIGLMTFAAFTGSMLRLVLNVYLGFPLSFCTVLACLVLFIALSRGKINFPPAGAILLIPLIINKNLLPMFSVEVFIGAAVLCCASMILFKSRKDIICVN